jgi:NAD(P)-dependent dehydrogenase (short-subunit alcohol dehydrogenase family)
MAPARSLAGLKVLVTGASSGIGAALSAVLAERGATVFGTGRDGGALEEEGGHFVASLAQDLTEPGAPEAVVSAACKALGGLDVVVSNAGAGWSGPFEDMSSDELDRLLDINLRAPLHLAQAAAPHLRHSPDGGQLVLIGSIAGLVGVPGEVAYCTAKAGLRGLAESLRAEWNGAASGTGGTGGAPTVTLVSPGPVTTPFYARRNRPYMRSWPKPVSVEIVANKIVAAIERRQLDMVVPSWLALPARLNGGLPSLYYLLYRRQGRRHHRS